MIEIWGRASSSNVQKVLWACEETGLAFERHSVGGGFGGGDAPDYRAMNPNGLVPTIRDGDLVMWESDAILRRLARIHGRGTLWPEDDEAALAHADMWTTWGTSVFYPALRPLFFGTVRKAKAEQDFDALAPFVAPLAAAIDILDRALEGRKFLCADRFTYGEIGPAITARRARALPFGAASGENVSRWLATLAERPGFQRWVDVPMGACREEWDAHERALG